MAMETLTASFSDSTRATGVRDDTKVTSVQSFYDTAGQRRPCRAVMGSTRIRGRSQSHRAVDTVSDGPRCALQVSHG